jgi:hypothetical protein
MGKSDCRIDKIKDNCAQLIANRKKSILCIDIKFGSYQKLLAFTKALQLNNYEIA